ncbi:iron-containing alcohol dehydrogenase [Actibacterium sp. 188UL27-1]|uniref:iron-containing alcohol dehydrogenase n=1 Tax=Actibacterium sp. 188UL27-1 TaxID=2786961 RepID=UPI00195D398B|nr:iron-containing alcohol dehydrogenase [Actibacterium sp. 188UL27-1]MBM7069047.1 iron-containing alcohol dehydrogenase [Actibacterium sp. 188UL27-1]
MTLITYPTRVHFADDVLEGASHSELEREGHRAPLLVMPHLLAPQELEDRARASLPATAYPQSVTYLDSSELRDIAEAVAKSEFVPDVIIAFGAARAIELARKCRYALGQRLKSRLPLYAIPGVDGLPGPCTRNLESWPAGLPSVMICDPTIAIGAGQVQCQRASVLSLVRCCESYLTNAYNPPADGMALDGLNRCVINLPKIGTIAGVDLKRELMAANLNAALSQEKEIGPALAISAVLMRFGQGLEDADFARLVLPAVIRVQDVNTDKANALLKVLGHKHIALDQAMDRILGAVEGPKTLAGLGVPHGALDAAAQAAVGKGGLEFEGARQALDDVYGDASQ